MLQFCDILREYNLVLNPLRLLGGSGKSDLSINFFVVNIAKRQFF